MSVHRTGHARAPSAFVGILLVAGGGACAARQAGSTQPATAADQASTSGAQPPDERGAPTTPSLKASGGASPPSAAPREQQEQREQGNEGDADAELIVSTDVVSRCPTLRLVRAHVNEFDSDMLWLAVLESIADCMSEDGPMADQTIGVSGEEQHRHVVREVLGSRGVAPTRVIARPAATDRRQGAAECQGGLNCNRRVEITVMGR
jgi:hypothetical protein